MSVVAVLTIAGWVVAPTLMGAAVTQVPRFIRVASDRLSENKVARQPPLTVATPIEELARALRRLLTEHDSLRGAPAAIYPADRLRALEVAIAGCAMDAAAALGVAHRHVGAPDSMVTDDLGTLLRSLAAAGLVLPAASDLLLAGLSG